MNPKAKEYEINTEGGSAIIGNVNTKGGDFIGRDKNIFLFKDIRQLALFLSVLLGITGSVALGYIWSLQPVTMIGDFNIAVAKFNVISTSSNLDIGSIIGTRIAGFLDAQSLSVDFGKVQVQSDKIGIISDAASAESLARKINADLVIYGDITEIDEVVTILPKFYVREPLFRVNIGEINGQYQLAYPIEFLVSQLKQDSQSTKILRERTAIISEFVKGLIYLFADDLYRAQEKYYIYLHHVLEWKTKTMRQRIVMLIKPLS
jgi:hypothetical protein